ncbi:hypothetical protein METBIDRAFT_46676 [Metschnikowia bicuspidata var. bicuspidata NRRL YB-4993]|uniref:GH16 domain-containing protein n=1 Tax=Metschnikowia bicuspidata var. bicuspidata NRRL YB-4993 TaxID=869754 RepID=A0A1A0H5W3_9ASCO|nr:hypothetical protein METBIDRAFT_46676 [Metschnikowia bicuspidata var. bicuspidata NRRL YB-4993]OBA19345.1 hypothetical protein METBIDRAFT_46676 [Metschnikowia bicuspidata var. bicuspidata NRRL YB-4993]
MKIHGLSLVLNLFSILFLACTSSAYKEFCNPQKNSSCIARNRALQEPVKDPLTNNSAAFAGSNSCPLLCPCDNGTNFGILQRFDNPRLSSTEYILYGRAEADIMGAPGQGIISSFYLQSDDLDEIDIAEIFGSAPAVYQTNFFVKGDVANYADGAYHRVTNSTTQNFHRYGVQWNRLEIEWTLDGQVVRHRAGGTLPSSPMRVILSLWVGGDEANDPGTVQWAGGPTDFADAPFSMYARNIYVENYSDGGCYVYETNLTVSIEDECRQSQYFVKWNSTS